MKAIVLSGGGVKGAFQIGVLRTLLDNNPNLEYDLYSGTSVGALNSTKLASGVFSEKLAELEDIWLNKVKGNGSVWSHHLWRYILIGIWVILFFMAAAFLSFIFSAPKWVTILFGLLTIASFYIPYYSLTHTHSIYTTDPLRKLIQKNIDLQSVKTSGKGLRIGAVSFTTGEYRVVDEQTDDLIDWIMASSAFPVFFPRVPILGQYWTDGGVTDIAPLSSVIEAGATEIDIILASPTNAGYYYGLPGITKQFMRDIDIMSSEILRNDLEARCAAHKGKIKIRVFEPEVALTSNALDFDPNKIKRMYNEGKRIAEKMLNSD